MSCGIENLVVKVDVLDVERNVLFGFPVMDSASSAAVITGRMIFLTITAFPDSEAATSVVVNG